VCLLLLSLWWYDRAPAQSQVLWNGSIANMLPPVTMERLMQRNLGMVRFPTAAEVQGASVAAPPEAVDECVKWLRRVVAEKWLPADVGAHLIPLRRWANGRDAFAVRYTVGGVRVQIVDSRSETTILVEPLGGKTPAPQAQHADFIVSTASSVLTLPSAAAVSLRPDEQVSELSVGSWRVHRPDRVEPGKHSPIGGINIATDGSFAVFCLWKQYGFATPRPPSVIDKPLFDEEPAAQPAPEPQPTPKQAKCYPPSDHEAN
jgi:hypothetical protein